LSALFLASTGAWAQVVNVTVGLDSPQIGVGGSTKLHVYAQIIPSLVTNTDRIFSWYVDLLDSSGSVATNNFALLIKPASDKDPTTSSPGRPDGANLRAIYDTFINLPNAGRTNRVELFNVPVTGVSTGKVTLSVQAGTTANLGADFIVAPAGGGDPLVGGVYSVASIDLNVVGGGPRVSIARPASGQATISFAVVAGQNYFVESSGTLAPGSWVTLPNGPHNGGSVTDTNVVAQRFYRLRIGP
jgi:hypothetical protein